MIDYSEKPEEKAPEPEPAPEEGTDAEVIVLRGENGEMIAEAATANAKQQFKIGARKRKAIWNHRLEGAKTRAGTLPRLMTASLSAAATNLMLTQLIQQELVPTTAKEAAEVAKITHAIYREASGATAGNLNLTPAERTTRMNEIDALEKELKQRAAAATEELGGAPAEGELIPDEPDLPAEVPVPASTPQEESEWEHEAG